MRNSLAILALLALAACDGSSDRPVPAKAPAAVSGPPPPAEVAAFKSDMARFLSVAEGCEGALDAVSAATQKGDPYELYSAATAAGDSCTEAAAGMTAFAFSPAINAGRRAQLEAMRAPCAESMTLRSAQMAAIATVANGDASPKAVDTGKRAKDAAEAGSSACMLHIVSAANKAGFDGWSVIPGGEGKTQ